MGSALSIDLVYALLAVSRNVNQAVFFPLSYAASDLLPEGRDCYMGRLRPARLHLDYRVAGKP